MFNFQIHNITKNVFGRGGEEKAGQLCREFGAKNKVLIIHSGGSAVRSGLIDRVAASLEAADLEWMDLGGVKPNPRLEHVRECIELARPQGIDFVLAVGGGSVLDTAKAIAVGLPHSGDIYDFIDSNPDRKKIAAKVPMGCISTISAAGSENSGASVLTIEERGEKTGIHHPILKPSFAILNPELTFTLPPQQTAYGAVDIIMHSLEGYFSNSPDNYLTDMLAEAVFKTIIKFAPIALAQPDHYEARAQIMWAGCISHNDTTRVGRIQNQTGGACHKMQARIGAKYDSNHGAGLATICPAWMLYVYKHNIPRFVRFATEVWRVENDVFNPEAVALEGIRRTKDFFKSLGAPVTLSELGVKDEDLDELCAGIRCGGNPIVIEEADARAIYELAR